MRSTSPRSTASTCFASIPRSGLRLKPHATAVGKILLAGLPDNLLAAWLEDRVLERYTPHTITEPAALVAELSAIRALGHATDREERTLGAACVAVAIRDHLGTCIAAMSVSAPAVRFAEREREAALIHLREAADELSAALGHTESYAPVVRATVNAPSP